MNRIIKTAVLIVLALATVSWPAMAQQATTVAPPATGAGDRQTFSLSGNSFTINRINQVDAMRLQEMGVQTVSVPAGEQMIVTYMAGALGPDNVKSMVKGPYNMIVFGPNGFAGPTTYTGAIADKSMQTFTFTGNAGQYYVITQRTDGIRDLVLVSFD